MYAIIVQRCYNSRCFFQDTNLSLMRTHVNMFTAISDTQKPINDEIYVSILAEVFFLIIKRISSKKTTTI